MFKKWEYGITIVKESDIRYFYIEMNNMINILADNFNNMQIISNQVFTYHDKKDNEPHVIGIITYKYTQHRSLIQFLKDYINKKG